MSTEKLAEVSVTLIYRHFLRALRTYPSVKQAQYIVACREQRAGACSGGSAGAAAANEENRYTLGF